MRKVKLTAFSDLFRAFSSPCIFSPKHAVIEDDDGISKGYGFVRFTDEHERNMSYTELDGSAGLGKKTITIKPALAPKTRYLLFVIRRLCGLD